MIFLNFYQNISIGKNLEVGITSYELYGKVLKVFLHM